MNTDRIITIPVWVAVLVSIFLILVPFTAGLMVGARAEKAGGTITLRENIKKAIISGKAQKVDVFFIAEGARSTKKAPVTYIWLAGHAGTVPSLRPVARNSGTVPFAGAGDQGMRKVSNDAR